jgi:hypothetical protein
MWETSYFQQAAAGVGLQSTSIENLRCIFQEIHFLYSNDEAKSSDSMRHLYFLVQSAAVSHSRKFSKAWPRFYFLCFHLKFLRKSTRYKFPPLESHYLPWPKQTNFCRPSNPSLFTTLFFGLVTGGSTGRGPWVTPRKLFIFMFLDIRSFNRIRRLWWNMS